MITIDALNTIFEKYPDPATGQSIVKAGRVVAPRIDGNTVKLILDFPSAKDVEDFAGMRAELEAELRGADGVEDVQIVVSAPKASAKAPPPNLKPQQNAKPTPERPAGVKRIFAIGSGKGGVGKSTVTTNIATALRRQGLRVGVLDADIFGPSQVLMLGIKTRPQTNERDQIIPTETTDGIKMISIGQMVHDGDAIIWRGPMLMKAIQEFLFNVEWGELDALLIDLPPGTGDVQISLAQKTPLDGAIIVSTPQDVALIDARRAISMFDKLNVPIIGMIENMATHICTNCGHEDHIFGEGGVSAEAKTRGVKLLGALPLSRETREASDAGVPIARDAGTPFDAIAQELAKHLK